MIPTVASKAERLVPQHPKVHRQVAHLLAGISSAQITSGMPSVVTGKLADSRFRARLERRFLRKARVAAHLPDLLDSPAEAVIAHGEYGLQALVIDTGIVCHYSALRRIVDVAALSELASLLGVSLDTHDARLARASDSLSLAHLIGTRSPDGMEPLAAAILQGGLQCWACWIHRQPEALRGFFHQLTPPALLVDGGPAGKGCTKRDCKHRAALFDTRRALVVEMDEMPVRREA